MLGLVAALGLWAAWARLRTCRAATGSLLQIAGAVLVGPMLFGSTFLLYAAGFAVASGPAAPSPSARIPRAPHSSRPACG